MMVKLYWRVKRNGKWTWSAATVIEQTRYQKSDKKMYLDVEILLDNLEVEEFPSTM